MKNLHKKFKIAIYLMNFIYISDLQCNNGRKLYHELKNQMACIFYVRLEKKGKEIKTSLIIWTWYL